eukprot:TRINITY_DN51153_c0_g1_i1.p1 TRINITY_DN51153_c0_g1~~TRINITY_DN51153_c0_g1_i1.p1  ORF type:complete len:650 (+),score=148.18 TRINITY_DN51153_c0_g1_i1:76-2025(+)
MRVIGLISGGKDSIYSLQKCVEHGHELACVANLAPAVAEDEEIDSWCFQTVGHHHIEAVARALGLPLLRGTIQRGASLLTGMDYQPTDPADEVESLYALLQRCKEAFPDARAVCSGAILSNYQRLRVESVCHRLGLISLAYLWQREQDEYMDELAAAGVDARIVKVAAMGLKPRAHLGRSVTELRDLLRSSEHCHSAGEGGEYETFVVDSPLYRYPLLLSEARVEMIDDNAVCATGLLHFSLAPGAEKSPPPVVGPRAPCAPKARPTRGPRGGERAAAWEATAALPAAWRSRCGRWAAAVGRAVLGDHGGDAEAMGAAAMRTALGGLELDPGDVCYSHVWASDIDDFAAINRGYSPNFGCKPPSRAFVEAGTGVEQRSVAVELLAHAGPRETLHVQSISEWAPACIGPYSQATSVGGCVLHAGMIGMDPPTLDVVGAEGDDLAQLAAQVRRTLRSCAAVLDCVASAPALTAFGTAFVVDPAVAPEAWAQWAAFAGGAPLALVVVSAMPKLAAFELQLVTGAAGARPERAEGGGARCCSFSEQVFALAELPSDPAAARAALQAAHDLLNATGAEPGYLRVFAPSAGWGAPQAAAEWAAALPSRPAVSFVPCVRAALLTASQDAEAAAAAAAPHGLAMLWGCRTAPDSTEK